MSSGRLFGNKVFVSPAVVKPHFPIVRFIDARYSLMDPEHYGKKQFTASRAAGAVFAEIESPAFCGSTQHTTARHPLPEIGNFQQWCATHNIGGHFNAATLPTPLSSPHGGWVPVCYDDQGGGLAACRVWWMLQDLGIEAYVLNGGFQGYCASGDFPIETVAPSAAQNVNVSAVPFRAAKPWSYATSWQRVVSEAHALNPSVYLVDGRTADRYGSSVRPFGLDVLPGHLPNAVNHPWPSNLAPAMVAAGGNAAAPYNALKPDAALRTQMEKSYGTGHTSDNTVFMCASGVTACINIAVSTHVGLGTPRLFVGSWSLLGGSQRQALLERAMDQNIGCLAGSTGTPSANVIKVGNSKVDALLSPDGSTTSMVVEIPKPNLHGSAFNAATDNVVLLSGGEGNWSTTLTAPIDVSKLPPVLQKVIPSLKTLEPAVIHIRTKIGFGATTETIQVELRRETSKTATQSKL